MKILLRLRFPFGSASGGSFFMLSQENRLRDRKDFSAVYRRGRFFSGGFLSLKALKRENKAIRIGFSVGLKFSKKAVERNRLRRQLRGVVKANLPNIKEGYDMVFMAGKGALPQFAELTEMTEALLKKANLLK